MKTATEKEFTSFKKLFWYWWGRESREDYNQRSEINKLTNEKNYVSILNATNFPNLFIKFNFTFSSKPLSPFPVQIFL